MARLQRMATLNHLGEEPKRTAVIDDACRVLDAEVSDKSGITGLAIKAAYKVVQGVRPGFVRQVVDHLLDDFLSALTPVYEEARQLGEQPGRYLQQHSSRVADAMLAVTDGRAARAEGSIIKKTYEKLRPTAKKHVEAAAPRLADMLERHTR
jgi:hypothetical protein